MANRWTPEGGPSKTDKYEWRSPSNENQHAQETVAPGDLRIKPKDLSLNPTISPERSGIQYGQDTWNFTSENVPDQTWYIFGSIPED